MYNQKKIKIKCYTNQYICTFVLARASPGNTIYWEAFHVRLVDFKERITYTAHEAGTRILVNSKVTQRGWCRENHWCQRSELLYVFVIQSTYISLLWTDYFFSPI